MPLTDVIAEELANPVGRPLGERMLEAMFLMERSRGINDGWDVIAPHIGHEDVGEASISHLARALRVFVRAHPKHPDIGSAVLFFSRTRKN